MPRHWSCLKPILLILLLFILAIEAQYEQSPSADYITDSKITTKRPSPRLSAHGLINLLLRNRLSLAHRMANKRTREDYFNNYKSGFLASPSRRNPISIVGLDNLHILVAGNNRAKSRTMTGGGRRRPFGAKAFLNRMRTQGR